MAQKQGSMKSSRAHKESKGTGKGSRPTRLTPLQKVLLVNGGAAHHLRKGQHRREADGTKANRKSIEAAQESAARQKAADRARKTESMSASVSAKR